LVAKNVTTNEMHKRDDIMVAFLCFLALVLLLIFFNQADYASRLNEWAKEEKSKGHTTPQVLPLRIRLFFIFIHLLRFFQSEEPPMPDVRNVWYRSIRENVTEGDTTYPPYCFAILFDSVYLQPFVLPAFLHQGFLRC
jgi:hypothetical protein